MKKKRGFTLVELMIVVAIIGIIASIAIPIYGDFLTRAKVSEAVTLLGGLKNPMVEYYHGRGNWPAITSVGGKTSGAYTSIITKGGPDPYEKDNNIDVFWIQATLKGGVLEGKRLRVRYILNQGPDSFGDWDCTTYGILPDGNKVPEKFLPSPCRQ